MIPYQAAIAETAIKIHNIMVNAVRHDEFHDTVFNDIVAEFVDISNKYNIPARQANVDIFEAYMTIPGNMLHHMRILWGDDFSFPPNDTVIDTSGHLH